MSIVRFTEEFKLEAVKQITEHQRPVADVAKRLFIYSTIGVAALTTKSFMRYRSASGHEVILQQSVRWI